MTTLGTHQCSLTTLGLHSNARSAGSPLMPSAISGASYDPDSRESHRTPPMRYVDCNYESHLPNPDQPPSYATYSVVWFQISSDLQIAAPLTKRTQKNQFSKFGLPIKEELTALEELRNTHVPTPVLAQPNFSGHEILDANTCDVRAGCASLQKQSDSTLNKIGYRSRSFNDSKRQYKTTQRESLPVF